MLTPDIVRACLVCGKQGILGTLVFQGWRLAPNRIGGYTCSIACDNVVVAYDEAKKAEVKVAKAAKKAK